MRRCSIPVSAPLAPSARCASDASSLESGAAVGAPFVDALESLASGACPERARASLDAMAAALAHEACEKVDVAPARAGRPDLLATLLSGAAAGPSEADGSDEDVMSDDDNQDDGGCGNAEGSVTSCVLASLAESPAAHRPTASPTDPQLSVSSDLGAAQLLGRGASATVRIAHSPVLGSIAVKSIGAGDDERRTAAACELAFARRAAEVLAADPTAEHRVWQHIARLFGVESDASTGACTVVSEAVLGGSLRAAAEDLRIPRDQGVSPSRADDSDRPTSPGSPELCRRSAARFVRAVARQLLSALATLHEELRVVHNDVKLENVLLAADCDQVTVKLIDFGCASVLRLGSDANDAHALPQRGSLSTMSPERLMGDAYGAKADVWAAGVTLLQLASGGRHPFLDATSAQKASDDVDAAAQAAGSSTGTFWRMAAALQFTEGAAECEAATTGLVAAALDASALRHNAGFRDLVESMLAPSPARRPSAAELLAQHPWLQM